MFTDGLPEFDHAHTVGIMGVAFFQSLTACLFNALRGIKIRFAHLEMDYGNAFAFHLSGPFQNIHDNERGNFRKSVCNHGDWLLLSVIREVFPMSLT
jgi:hypothetical protein